MQGYSLAAMEKTEDPFIKERCENGFPGREKFFHAWKDEWVSMQNNCHQNIIVAGGFMNGAFLQQGWGYLLIHFCDSVYFPAFCYDSCL